MRSPRSMARPACKSRASRSRSGASERVRTASAAMQPRRPVRRHRGPGTAGTAVARCVVLRRQQAQAEVVEPRTDTALRRRRCGKAHPLEQRLVAACLRGRIAHHDDELGQAAGAVGVLQPLRAPHPLGRVMLAVVDTAAPQKPGSMRTVVKAAIRSMPSMSTGREKSTRSSTGTPAAASRACSARASSVAKTRPFSRSAPTPPLAAPWSLRPRCPPVRGSRPRTSSGG